MVHQVVIWLVLAFKAPNNEKPTGKGVQLIDTKNASALKDVFFYGYPWLVQCGSATDIAAAASDTSLALHEVVEAAVPKLGTNARVGILDCSQKLPNSGKTTFERFRLDIKVVPTLVFAANGLPPFQLLPETLGKHGGLSNELFPSTRRYAHALAAMVKASSEKKALALTKSDHMHKHCLKRKHCAVVVLPHDIASSGDTARTLQKVMNEFRTVSFVTINAARYDFSLSKFLPKPENPKQPQLVAFKSATVDAPAERQGKEEKGKKKSAPPKKALSVGAKAHRGDFTAAELKPFLASLVADSLEMTPLKKAPTIKWRKQDKGGGGSGKGSAASSKQQQQQQRESRRNGGGSKSDRGSSAAGGGSRRSGGGAAAARDSKGSAKGGGAGKHPAGDGGPSDEVRRRQQMAEEEEEYLRSMFGDGDDDGAGADDANEQDEDGADVDEALDFDDDEDADERDAQDAEDDVEGDADGGAGHDEL